MSDKKRNGLNDQVKTCDSRENSSTSSSVDPKQASRLEEIAQALGVDVSYFDSFEAGMGNLPELVSRVLAMPGSVEFLEAYVRAGDHRRAAAFEVLRSEFAP